MTSDVQFEEKDFLVCENEIQNMAELNDLVWCVSAKGTIAVRDARTAQEAFTIPHFEREFAWCLDTVQYTNTIWIAYNSGVIRVFEGSGVKLSELHQHSVGVTCLKSIAEVVFTGDSNANIVQWAAKSMTKQRSFQGHTGPIRCLYPVVTRNQMVLLYSGSDDCTVRQWRAFDPKAKLDAANVVLSGEMMVAHTGGVHCLTVCANHIWSGGEDTPLRVTAVQPPFRAAALSHVAKDRPLTVLFSPQHSTVVFAGGVDRSLVLWDALSLMPLHSFTNSNNGCLHNIRTIREESLRRVMLWTSATDSTLHRWTLAFPEDSVVESIPTSSSSSSTRLPNGTAIIEDRDQVRILQEEVLQLRGKESYFKQRIEQVQGLINTAENHRDDMQRRHKQEIQRLGRAAKVIPSVEKYALDALSCAVRIPGNEAVIAHLRSLLDILTSGAASRQTNFPSPENVRARSSSSRTATQQRQQSPSHSKESKSIISSSPQKDSSQ